MTSGRIRRPFWAARPTRFASLTRSQARIALVVAAIIVLACFSALGGRSSDTAIGAAIGQSIVDGMRQGGAFYAVAQEVLRGDGALTFPMPVLAPIEAALPRWIDLALLYALIAGVIAAWFVRLRPAFQRGAALVPPMLVAVGAALALRAELVALPAVWAGGFIALSLAARRPGRWIEPAAFAAIAMLIEPAAALYAVVMLLFALAEGERREALGWATALAAFALAFTIHLLALDTGDAAASIGLLGLGPIIRAGFEATALAILPTLIAAPLIGLSLVGWAAWPDPAGPRAATILAAYFAFFAVIATGDTIDRVMLIAPLLFVGLAFAPDAIGDLVHRMLDRRRITVTRMMR